MINICWIERHLEEFNTEHSKLRRAFNIAINRDTSLEGKKIALSAIERILSGIPMINANNLSKTQNPKNHLSRNTHVRQEGNAHGLYWSHYERLCQQLEIAPKISASAMAISARKNYEEYIQSLQLDLDDCMKSRIREGIRTNAIFLAREELHNGDAANAIKHAQLAFEYATYVAHQVEAIGVMNMAQTIPFYDQSASDTSFVDITSIAMEKYYEQLHVSYLDSTRNEDLLDGLLPILFYAEIGTDFRRSVFGGLLRAFQAMLTGGKHPTWACTNDVCVLFLAQCILMGNPMLFTCIQGSSAECRIALDSFVTLGSPSKLYSLLEREIPQRLPLIFPQVDPIRLLGSLHTALSNICNRPWLLTPAMATHDQRTAETNTVVSLSHDTTTDFPIKVPDMYGDDAEFELDELANLMESVSLVYKRFSETSSGELSHNLEQYHHFLGF